MKRILLEVLNLQVYIALRTRLILIVLEKQDIFIAKVNAVGNELELCFLFWWKQLPILADWTSPRD